MHGCVIEMLLVQQIVIDQRVLPLGCRRPNFSGDADRKASESLARLCT
jgi:hypothetical protein